MVHVHVSDSGNDYVYDEDYSEVDCNSKQYSDGLRGGGLNIFVSF